MALRGYIHAAEILTGAGVRKKDGRRLQEEDLSRVSDGAVIFSTKKIGRTEVPDRVEWVGESKALPKKYARVKKKDLKGQSSIVPGLIDCHTHLVFAGDRSEEFALRCAGMSYEEIARRGGGIVSSVKSTREATARELEKLAIARVKESRAFGVKTLEIKSGYGLGTAHELKILRVAQKLKRHFPDMTFSVTFLGAHAFPKEKSRESYLREILEEMLPQVAREKLADSCDVFVDEGYFTIEEASHILNKAKSLRLKIKVHADELGNTECAQFAAQMGALSADHLLQISEAGIRKLAASQTVAVLLPGTAFYLKAPQAPARKLIEAGACVAISTDFNPGTCMSLSLPTMLTIGALYLQMSRAELFASVTYNAAKALGLSDRKGSVEPGLDADLTILPYARFEELYYRFAPAGF